MITETDVNQTHVEPGLRKSLVSSQKYLETKLYY